MKKKEMERIFIDKDNVDTIEEDIIIRRMIERYMYVRQFVYGRLRYRMRNRQRQLFNV